MAEIKSTLDLVMERTKHLSLSDEEKREQKQAELRMRIKGLVLKAQDQTVKIEQVEQELKGLQKEQGTQFQKLLREELLNEIRLEGDNRLPVILLRRLGQVKTDKLESLLHDYRQAIQKKAIEEEQLRRASLLKSHSISGSAVMPNLDLDEKWVNVLNKIRGEFSLHIEKEKNRLIKEV